MYHIRFVMTLEYFKYQQSRNYSFISIQRKELLMLTHDYTEILNGILEAEKGSFLLPQADNPSAFEAVGFRFSKTRQGSTRHETTLPSGWKFKVDANYFEDYHRGINLVDEYGNRRVELLNFSYLEKNVIFGNASMALKPFPKNSLKVAKHLNEELVENGFCIVPKRALQGNSCYYASISQKSSFEDFGFQFEEKDDKNYQMTLPFHWKFKAHFDYSRGKLKDGSWSVSIVDEYGLERGYCLYTHNHMIDCQLYNIMVDQTIKINKVKKNGGILTPLELFPNQTAFENLGFKIRKIDLQQDESVLLDTVGHPYKRAEERYHVKLPSGWKLSLPSPLIRKGSEHTNLLILDREDALRGICFFEGILESKIMLF